MTNWALALWRIKGEDVLLIPCPHCGGRDEVEFRYGGEIQPTPDGEQPIDDNKRNVFLRANTAGVIQERWYHLYGCRQWLTLRRDTRTDAFLETEVRS